MKRILFASLMVLSLAAPAFAQQESDTIDTGEKTSDGKAIRVRKHDEVDFTNAPVIRGEVEKPMGKFFVPRRAEKFQVMIDERPDFKAALATSLDNLRK